MGSTADGKSESGRVIDMRFIKFLLVGGLNTLFGYGVFAGLVALGLHYSLAAFLATILGILFNFKTYGTLVFRNPDNRLIVRFIGVYAVTYGLTVGLIGLLKLLHLTTYSAGAVIVLPMALLSYSLNRRWVFARRPEGRASPRPEPPAAPVTRSIS